MYSPSNEPSGPMACWSQHHHGCLMPHGGLKPTGDGSRLRMSGDSAWRSNGSEVVAHTSIAAIDNMASRTVLTAQSLRRSQRTALGKAIYRPGSRGGEEIRDQAEGPASLAAVPTRNSQSRWRYALVTAMAGKAATAGRV